MYGANTNVDDCDYSREHRQIRVVVVKILILMTLALLYRSRTEDSFRNPKLQIGRS